MKDLEPLYDNKEARSILTVLCKEVLDIQSYTHIVNPEYAIGGAKEKLLLEMLGRLASGEPVQYVTGRTEFCGFQFKVAPGVLIPRPETEMLCHEAIEEGMRLSRMRSSYGKDAYPVRILDLCTGSGCIAWTMALSVPSAQTVAVDNSETALGIAESQDFSSLLKQRKANAPQFLNLDILGDTTDFNPPLFDIILSNPPYIRESEKAMMRKNVLDHEPAEALFVPDDDPLVFYRSIAGISKRLLTGTGMGIVEINEDLAHPTMDIFTKTGFSHVSAMKDFYDKNRFIIFRK